MNIINKRKKILIAAVLIITLIGIGLSVNAQTVNCGGTVSSSGNGTLQNPLSCKYSTVAGLVGGFLEILTYIGVILAVLAILYVGFQFVVSGSKPNKMTELKNWLLWILVGVALVIGARVILKIVVGTLESTGTVSPVIINSAKNAIEGN